MSTHVKNFTTTLPAYILNAIDIASKDLAIPKNEVIIKAFLNWNHARKQSFVAKSYASARDDFEWKNISQEGLSDYNKNIQLWEK